VQLARGQSSGESQAAYATGPKTIPPSRHAAGSDPAPAVIVDGAQAHTYEPLETPPPSSSRGGLYLAPVPAFPSVPDQGSRGRTVPMAPAFAAPQFAAPPPPMRGRTRSETVVITMPGRRRGPSSREKVLAFVVVLVIVALLGIIVVLWRGLEQRKGAAASPDPSPVVSAAAPPAPPAVEPVVTAAPVAAPPPVAVVVAPALLIDAGAKKLPLKKAH